MRKATPKELTVELVKERIIEIQESLEDIQPTDYRAEEVKGYLSADIRQWQITLAWVESQDE